MNSIFDVPVAPLCHPMVFLLGLHGVGKTTVGRILQIEYGYQHFSVGELCRSLRRKRLPAGLPLRLLRLLAAHEPGARMSAQLVHALLEMLHERNQRGRIVVDGFPCEPYHVLMLPEGSALVELNCTESERERRLRERSDSSVRKWTPGQDRSLRDLHLPAVLAVARERAALHVCRVDTDRQEPQEIARRIRTLSAGTPVTASRACYEL